MNIIAMLEELNALYEERARIDWLESVDDPQALTIYRCREGYHITQIQRDGSERIITPDYETLREAIDEARRVIKT